MIPIGAVVLFLGVSIPNGWEDASTNPETKMLCELLLNGIKGYWSADEKWHDVSIKCIVKVSDAT